MVTEILAIVGAVASVGGAYVLRRWKQKDDPRNQIEQEKSDNRSAIADGSAGDLLERRIDRVPPAEDHGH